MPFDYIGSKDFKPFTMLFAKNGHDLYDCYEKYRCPKCKTFNWYEATLNGIHAVPKLPLKMPDLVRTDWLCAYIISTRAKEVFASATKEHVTFFPIPNYSSNFVLLPKRMLYHPDSIPLWEESPSWKDGESDPSPFRAQGPKCETCGLYPQVGICMERFLVPDDVSFAGIHLGGYGMVLVASRIVAEELKKAKLGGLNIEKNAFANPKK